MAATNSGVLGRGLRIRGEVQGEGELSIEGQVLGAVRLKDTLVIEKTAELDAEIEAPRVIVRGRVAGSIRAEERILLKPTSVVRGDLVTPLLVLEEGAALDGHLEMNVDLPPDVRARLRGVGF